MYKMHKICGNIVKKIIQISLRITGYSVKMKTAKTFWLGNA